MYAFVCVFDLFCVRSGLATDISLAHEVFPNVYMIQSPGKRHWTALDCRPTDSRQG
jgi:hypothetical protein